MGLAGDGGRYGGGVGGVEERSSLFVERCGPVGGGRVEIEAVEGDSDVGGPGRAEAEAAAADERAHRHRPESRVGAHRRRLPPTSGGGCPAGYRSGPRTV